MFSFDTLFSRTQPAVLLSYIVGDDRPRKALFLARDVFEKFPAFFPDFAEQLADSPTEPRAACWSLASLLADCDGAYDLWRRATDLASL